MNFIMQVLDIVITLVAVMLVLTLHEFAHAFAAVKNGDLTPKMNGRYSLNPVVHFDLFGVLAMVLVGFGWAKPVPINPYNFNHFRKGLFWTSIAGVLTNFVLAFLFCPIVLLLFKISTTNIFLDMFVSLVSKFYVLNISFCIFNLIPLPPLDGFRVVEALNKKQGKVFWFFKNYGQYILLGLLLWSFVCSKLFVFTGLPFFKWADIIGIVLDNCRFAFDTLFTMFWSLII